MTAALGFHVVESTIFAALVAVLVFALRKRGASFRYALWLTAVAKFAVPVALFSMLGIHFGSALPSQYSSMASAVNFPIHAYQVVSAPSVSASHQHSAIAAAIGGLAVSFSWLEYGFAAVWRLINVGTRRPNRNRACWSGSGSIFTFPERLAFN